MFAEAPAGRVAIVTVAGLWLAIGISVVIGWISWDVAAFLGAAALTFSVLVLLSFDFVVELLDSEPRERSLRPRFQPSAALPQAPSWLVALHFAVVPALFLAGTVIGHFIWH